MRRLYQISQQTVWQLLGKFISSLSTLLILSLVTRHFGTEGTGVFTLALAFLGFFYLAVDSGINAYVLPKLFENNFQSEWNKLFGLRLLIVGVLITLASLIILFWPNLEKSFQNSVLVGVPAILGFGLTVTATAFFQSRLRFDLNVTALSFGAVISLIVVYLIIQQGMDIHYVMLGPMLGYIATGTLSLGFLRKYLNPLPTFDLAYFKNTFFTSWPIAATLALNTVYFRVDTFILSHFKSFTEVGIYNVAFQLFQFALVLPAFIMNSFYPLMLKDFKESILRFKDNLIKASLIMLGLSLGGTVLTFFLSPLAIEVITSGQGFDGSVDSLRILSLGFPAFFISSVLMWTLVVFRRYKTMLLIYFLGLTFNISANWFFIPLYSYTAASWITVFSEYLILILEAIILIPYLRKS